MYGREQDNGDSLSRADREIGQLIVSEIRPVVSVILERHARSGSFLAADLEDIAATVDLRALEVLRSIHAGRHGAIEDLRAYAATLTANVVNDFLRKRFPERARLKNRVRYALIHDSRLAMWRASRGSAGGLRAWEGRDDTLDSVPAAISISTPVAGETHGAVLLEIFEVAGQPLLVEGLVDFLQVSWNLGPQQDAALADDAPSRDRDAAMRAEDLDAVRALWDEIRDLRPLQRKALLLNLRYEGDLDLLSVLVLARIATLRDLAEALEMSERALHAIWKELPLDDLHIARLLGVNRQQVINLRKAARARLARRVRR